MGSLPVLPQVVEDCMGFLQLYSDGSVFRSNDIKFNVSHPPIQDNSVTFKDCVFDKRYNLSLRLFKPQKKNNNIPIPIPIPIVLFLHGGGFCFGSRTWPHFHNCCMRLASGLQALVVAPDYRLAPEHRLPAAIDDAVEAVRWLQRQRLSLMMMKKDQDQDHHQQEDAWLTDVDFDRLYIVGDSSGGNIAHHLAVRFGSNPTTDMIKPVRIRGYVLLAPFFGGDVRTKSEEGPPEHTLNLDLLDRFWRLSMPVGEISRDHPLANPFGAGSPNLDEVKFDPILVIVGGNELLKDRAAEYATKLKEMGKNIKYVEFEGCEHGFFTHDSYSQVAAETIHILKQFLIET